MIKTLIIDLTRTLAARAMSSGKPVLHLETQALALLAGGNWRLVDEAMFDALAEIEAERRRADPMLAEA